jgi:hypothetical protein
MSTRTGEGFQQEVARHYKRTSGVNAEHQVRPFISLFLLTETAADGVN